MAIKVILEDNRSCSNHEDDLLHNILIYVKLIHEQNQLIIMKQTELAAEMTVLTEKVAKIGTESTKTLEKVAELEEALNNQDNVSPELKTAFDNLKAQVTVVDDLIPDVTTPPIEGEGL